MTFLNFLFDRWQHIYHGPFHKYPNRPLHSWVCLFRDMQKKILPIWSTSWLSDKMKLLKVNRKIKICLFQCTFGRLQKLGQILIFAFWYFCLFIGKLIGILPWVRSFSVKLGGISCLFASGHMENTSLEHMLFTFYYKIFPEAQKNYEQ